MKQRIGVLGAGSWGATLADLLSRQGHDVSLWEFFPEAAEKFQKTRGLSILPALKLHGPVRVTSDLAQALAGVQVAVSAVPSDFVRATWREIGKKQCFPRDAWVVSASKGIENVSLKRMSEIIQEEEPKTLNRVAILSGPSHAEEVAVGIPTAVVSAGPPDLPEKTQTLFTTDHFRVYTSPDFIGVELAGALKNIYAIACGISDGLGLGDNTKAALLTRGLNEMVRLGIAAGAQGLTFFGLAGVGDLVVTCASRHSRNRLLGEKIGRGKTLPQALSEMTMVAEGVGATQSAHAMAKKLAVELPIGEEIHRCLFEGKPARECLQALMTRPVGPEMLHMETIFSSQRRIG